jgi:hypothetical protein
MSAVLCRTKQIYGHKKRGIVELLFEEVSDSSKGSVYLGFLLMWPTWKARVN